MNSKDMYNGEVVLLPVLVLLIMLNILMLNSNPVHADLPGDEGGNAC